MIAPLSPVPSGRAKTKQAKDAGRANSSHYWRDRGRRHAQVCSRPEGAATCRSHHQPDDRGARAARPRWHRTCAGPRDHRSRASAARPGRDRTGGSPSCSRRARPAPRRRRRVRRRRSGSSSSRGAITTARGGTARSACAICGESASGSLGCSGLQWENPCTATGSTKRNAANAPRPGHSSTTRRRKKSPTTSATAPPTNANQVTAAGPPWLQAVGEVARPEELQRNSRRESSRQDENRAREEREPAGERERERDEAGRAPRLRERDQVREVGEQRRHEHQRQDRDGPAEHERAPPAAGGEGRERDERERRDRDRAAAADEPGREPVSGAPTRPGARRRSGRARSTRCRARVVRERLVDERPQPEDDQPRRYAGTPRARSPRHATLRTARPRTRRAGSARTARRSRGRARAPRTQRRARGDRPASRLDVGEEERDRGRHEELPRRGRRQRERACTSRRGRPRGSTGRAAPQAPRTLLLPSRTPRLPPPRRRGRRAARGATPRG